MVESTSTASPTVTIATTSANSTSNTNFTASVNGVKYPVVISEAEFTKEWDIDSTSASMVAALNLDDIDVPFSAYSRNERLGRIADWTGQSDNYGRRSGGPVVKNATSPVEGQGGEEESGWTFSAETSSRLNAAAGGKGGNKMAGKGVPAVPRSNYDQQQNRTGGRPPMSRKFGGWGGRFGDRASQRKREPSVNVQPSWKIIEEIEFNRISKLQLDAEEADVLKTTGNAPIYENSFDKTVSTKSEKVIHYASVTSTVIDLPLEEDSTVKALVKDHKITTVISDDVASALMACQRTVYPWDIQIKRRGNLIIIDKRPGSTISDVFINETAQEPPVEDRFADINSMQSLSSEAIKLRSLLPTLLAKDSSSCSSGFIYSKIELGEGAPILVRSRLDALQTSPNNTKEPVLFTVLLEYEQKTGGSGMDWRQKLDSQRGAVVAQEIRNNGSLLARTVFTALLSNISHIKVAYCSRISPKDRTRHTLLALQDFETLELATHMNLNVENGFGILRAIVDLCSKLPDTSDYVLMRDPNKALLRIYRTSGDVDIMEDTIDDLVPIGAKVDLSDALSSDDNE